MAIVLSSNVTSPLGLTTAENYRAVKAGRSALRRYDGLWELPEPFTASLFSDGQRRAMALDGLTLFESIAVRSVREAVRRVPIDLSGKNVVFILSTTKGSAGQMQSPAVAAQAIASELDISTVPIVVCNACISGVAAIILANRLLDSGQYDYAVVCGADVQSRFTIAGFQSLKAVAADACRPFDMERTGLNLGEAAATVVLARGGCGKNVAEVHEGPDCKSVGTERTAVSIEAGAIRNDAFHISSPSKSGEGACLVLKSVLTPLTSIDALAFINAHGTATMFNDQMESVAIERAGLSAVPVNGLKGYYGHTLGAAGVLETVISMAALRDRTVLATRGFEERGVSGKISVAAGNAATDKTSFVKMISGFGGGNAALLLSQCRLPVREPHLSDSSSLLPSKVTHSVSLTPSSVTIDGEALRTSPLLSSLYRKYVGDYPRFYKMDGLARLGFIATELLLQAEKNGGGLRPLIYHPSPPDASRAIVLFNHSSSVPTDRNFLATIADGAFFPSPSLFIYTLPNIVAGEVALRNHYHGETSFYLLPRRDESLMRQVASATFLDTAVKSLITGWIDYRSDTDYEASLLIVEAPPVTTSLP